jgi:hypothetical protein
LIDNRVFEALAELLASAPVISGNVFIVGGTALWDWWYATEPSVRMAGGSLDEPRITKDVDLGIERRTLQVAGDPNALRSALVANGWKQLEPTSYIWTHPRGDGITIELLAHRDPGDQGQSIWIRDDMEEKVLRACATLTRLEPIHGLLEECRHESIMQFRIGRFSQLGLLLAKIVAIANVLNEFDLAERERRRPKQFTDRIGKDRYDALLLLNLSVRAGLTNLGSRRAMDEHYEAIKEEVMAVLILRKAVPSLLPASEHAGLRELAHAMAQWLDEIARPLGK